MSEEFLSPPELRRYGRGFEAQCKTLEAEGVPYRVVGKRILVSRVHVRMWLLGETLKQPQGPRLDLVR